MKLPHYSVRPDDPEFYDNPYPRYREMRALGPAFFWSDYDQVAFAGYEAVSAILRDRRFGREATHVMSREEAGLAPVPDHLRPFYDFESHSMLEREPPVHTRLRGLVNRAFLSRHVERLRGRIGALANELIDGFERNGEADLLPAYAERIPIVVICELLGVPTSMAPQLLEWSHRMVAMYQFNRTRETEDLAVIATTQFQDYIRSHVEQRRRRPGDDLISLLIAAEAEGDRLCGDELVTTCILLLNAGHEATVHATGNAIKALVANRVDVATVFADSQAAAAATDELLRYDPPLHLFSRFVLENLEFMNVRLKRGQHIALLLGAANRDPARFADPDCLDFQRGGAGHVAFGAGIHFCVGAPLARLEMAVALPVLFKRLPRLDFAEAPRFANRYHFHGLDRLVMRW